MADNNYDPTEVGGMQPIYCPQCGGEVKAQDSYQLSNDNQRYHYPECWQKHELYGDPLPASEAPAAAKSEPVPPPEEALDETEHIDESPYRYGSKQKKK